MCYGFFFGLWIIISDSHCRFYKRFQASLLIQSILLLTLHTAILFMVVFFTDYCVVRISDSGGQEGNFYGLKGRPHGRTAHDNKYFKFRHLIYMMLMGLLVILLITLLDCRGHFQWCKADSFSSKTPSLFRLWPEILGTLALVIEAMLPVPQLYEIIKQKSTANLRYVCLFIIAF